MKKFVLNRCFIHEWPLMLKWSPLQRVYHCYGTYRSGLWPAVVTEGGPRARSHIDYATGLLRHLARFPTNFLTNRTFKELCGATFSDTTQQDQGLPQGSVLSPTLFLIMINDKFKNLKPKTRSHVKYSFLADDVAIWATHLDPCIAERHIQHTLGHIAYGAKHEASPYQ